MMNSLSRGYCKSIEIPDGVYIGKTKSKRLKGSANFVALIENNHITTFLSGERLNLNGEIGALVIDFKKTKSKFIKFKRNKLSINFKIAKLKDIIGIGELQPPLPLQNNNSNLPIFSKNQILADNTSSCDGFLFPDVININSAGTSILYFEIETNDFDIVTSIYGKLNDDGTFNTILHDTSMTSSISVNNISIVDDKIEISGNITGTDPKNSTPQDFKSTFLVGDCKK